MNGRAARPITTDRLFHAWLERDMDICGLEKFGGRIPAVYEGVPALMGTTGDVGRGRNGFA
jgi:hypothetical protein